MRARKLKNSSTDTVLQFVFHKLNLVFIKMDHEVNEVVVKR